MAREFRCYVERGDFDEFLALHPRDQAEIGRFRDFLEAVAQHDIARAYAVAASAESETAEEYFAALEGRDG